MSVCDVCGALSDIPVRTYGQPSAAAHLDGQRHRQHGAHACTIEHGHEHCDDGQTNTDKHNGHKLERHARSPTLDDALQARATAQQGGPSAGVEHKVDGTPDLQREHGPPTAHVDVNKVHVGMIPQQLGAPRHNAIIRPTDLRVSDKYIFINE